MTFNNDSTDTNNPGDEPVGPVAGLFRSLSNLLASIVGIAQTRLELLTTELQEEIHRVAEIIVWAFVALLSAGIGLFLAALLIVFVFWDTHRVLASVLVTGVFFGITAVAVWVLMAKLRGKPPLLDGTLAELAKDREQLMRRRS